MIERRRNKNIKIFRTSIKFDYFFLWFLIRFRFRHHLYIEQETHMNKSRHIIHWIMIEMCGCDLVENIIQNRCPSMLTLKENIHFFFIYSLLPYVLNRMTKKKKNKTSNIRHWFMHIINGMCTQTKANKYTE